MCSSIAATSAHYSGAGTRLRPRPEGGGGGAVGGGGISGSERQFVVEVIDPSVRVDGLGNVVALAESGPLGVRHERVVSCVLAVLVGQLFGFPSGLVGGALVGEGFGGVVEGHEKI